MNSRENNLEELLGNVLVDKDRVDSHIKLYYEFRTKGQIKSIYEYIPTQIIP